MSKRNAPEDITASFAWRRARETRIGKATVASSSCQDILVSTDVSLVINELKTKVFSQDIKQLDADGATIANGVYTDLLKVFACFPNIKTCFYLSAYSF